MACAPILGVMLLAHHYCHVLIFADRSSNPELLVYRVDDRHRLVLGRDVALLIDTQERVVLSLHDVGRRWGGITLWPRDALKGVVLGDGVKGDERDSYQFGVAGVDIQYATPVENYALHVAL